MLSVTARLGSPIQMSAGGTPAFTRLRTMATQVCGLAFIAFPWSAPGSAELFWLILMAIMSPARYPVPARPCVSLNQRNSLSQESASPCPPPPYSSQGDLLMKEVVIVSATRIPVGKFQGSLQSFSAPRLGALVVREAVRRALSSPPDRRVHHGLRVQAGLGQNPARQAALYGGLSNQVAALTINKVCGSSLKAVALAAQASTLLPLPIHRRRPVRRT